MLVSGDLCEFMFELADGGLDVGDDRFGVFGPFDDLLADVFV